MTIIVKDEGLNKNIRQIATIARDITKILKFGSLGGSKETTTCSGVVSTTEIV